MNDETTTALPATETDRDTRAALKLWVVLTRAQRAMADRSRRNIESHGLSATEFAVLEVLLHKGPLPIGEVGERILLTSGSTTYVIDKLEERGLLRRRRCLTDRRVQYAELTKEGSERIAGIFPDHAEAMREAAGGLSAEEKERAIELVRKLGLAARSDR